MHAVTCPVCAAPLRRLFGLPGNTFVASCRRCGLRRLLPPPSKETLAVLYGRKEYFTVDLADLHDDLVEGYDPGSPVSRLYRQHLEHIKRLAPAPARMLEIGCARGVFLDMARRSGYEVAGVEMNAYAAAYGREHFKLDIADRPFETFSAPAASFDVIVTFDVIEHVVDPAAFVERIAALLRPGGIAVIGTPDTLSPLYILAEAAARMSLGHWTYPAWRFYGQGEHLSLFNAANLGRLLEKHGLEDRETYLYGIPTKNMRHPKGIYRPAMAILGRLPYEFVMIARKRAGQD